MQKITIIALAAILAGCGAGKSSYTIEEARDSVKCEYDKYKKTTKCESGDIVLKTGDGKVLKGNMWTFTKDGTRAPAEDAVAFDVVAIMPNWAFFKKGLDSDGNTLQIIEQGRTTSASSGLVRVIEVISIVMPRSTWGKRIEGKENYEIKLIGSHASEEVELPHSYIKGFLNWYDEKYPIKG